MSGGAGGGRRGWSPFDAIRSFPSTPESLMSQIDAAIASTEYARACALLDPASASSRSQQPPPDSKGEGQEKASTARAPPPAACHDARVADEAYRAACAALGAGRPDAAVWSLRVALASCPPEKAAAVAKVRSMLAIASAQLFIFTGLVPCVSILLCRISSLCFCFGNYTEMQLPLIRGQQPPCSCSKKR